MNKNITRIMKSSLVKFRGLILLLLPLFVGCKEEVRNDHIDYSAPAPGQVKDVTFRNTPGGAVLYYTLPADENLRYVRAEYEIRPGAMRETKSSNYKDSLVLEGFGDTRTYDVKVYSVGKNEKASDPVTVQVNPTVAPIHLATKTLKEGFGGVSVSIENPMKVSLAIELMGDTARLGYQTSLQTYYTSLEKATFTFRGLDTIPGNFSVYLRDRWYNLSDTINATLTPWYEEYIPKDTWLLYALPTDAVLPYGGVEGYLPYHLWDEDTTTPYSVYCSSSDYPLPQWLTWDLGMTAQISRFKIYPNPDWEYNLSTPKNIELWGSVYPNMNGSWDESWIPLGKFTLLPPSGNTTPTDADKTYARGGIDCELQENDFAPQAFVPVRYLRLKTIDTFDGPSPYGRTMIHEISMWGVIVEE